MPTVPTITGDSIQLRPFSHDDLDVVLAGVNEPVGQRLTGTHATFTREQVAAYIERSIAGDDRFAWIIALPDDTVIGEVIINELDSDNRSANIRIALFDPRYFGKGYGTQAMCLAVDYGFTQGKLHRIELGVYDFNPRALHVYEKIGFKREGIRRDSLFWDGQYHDEHTMSILEDEWATKLTIE